MMAVQATLHSGTGVRKGSWTDEEDNLLRQCIEKHGEGSWHRVPQRAGLNRCRKSCRLRWLNYLKPNIKRGQFSEDEVDLIIRLHKLLGNKWSLIAGRIPGRTANDVKNYWNTHLHKKLSPPTRLPKHPIITSSAPNTIIRPQPCTISKALTSFMGNNSDNNNKHDNGLADQTSTFHDLLSEDEDDDDNDNNANTRWWEKLGEKEENGLGYHEPNGQDVSNMWPSSSIQVPPRGPIINHLQLQERSIWEEDDLWNFDVNLWE